MNAIDTLGSRKFDYTKFDEVSLEMIRNLNSRLRDNILGLLDDRFLGLQPYKSKGGKGGSFRNSYSNCHGTTHYIHFLGSLKRPHFMKESTLYSLLKDYPIVPIQERTPGDIILFGHNFPGERFTYVHSSTYIGDILEEMVIFHQSRRGEYLNLRQFQRSFHTTVFAQKLN